MNDTESLFFASCLAGQILCYFPLSHNFITLDDSSQSKSWALESHMSAWTLSMKLSLFIVFIFSYAVGWPRLEGKPLPSHSLTNTRGVGEGIKRIKVR